MNPESIFLLVLGGLSILGSGYGIWCAWDVDREYRKRKRTPEIDWKRNPRVGMDEWDADFRKLSGEPEEPLPEWQRDMFYQLALIAGDSERAWKYSPGGVIPSQGSTWARGVEGRIEDVQQVTFADFKFPTSAELNTSKHY